MAYVIITEAEGISTEMYDSVNEKLFAQGPPPDGQLLHVAGVGDDGKLRVIDVWETVDAHDKFRDERLLPAIEETAREHGAQGAGGPPSNTIFEAHNVAVRPGVGQ
jgi:hypothetical protein